MDCWTYYNILYLYIGHAIRTNNYDVLNTDISDDNLLNLLKPKNIK